jgi:hypothetical protein
LRPVGTDGSENYPGVTTTLPKTSITNILNASAGQARQIVQRAASRALVQAIEATDGFKYSFNNAWSAKDEEGLRFSYICQDSMQNKDRHANGFHKTQKHLKGEGERGPRKPTYDCKGSISVKFSQVRKCVEVYYRHYAIHASVAERKAARFSTPKPKRPVRLSGPPAPATVPQRPIDRGGLLGALQSEQSAFDEPGHMAPPPRPTAVPNNLKRKRDADRPVMPMRDESNMSLADLLQQSEEASKPAPTDPNPKASAGYTVAPPVDYALPSWQAPPPPQPPPVRSPQQQQPYQPSWNGNGYAPPYQPQQYVPPAAPPIAIPRANSNVSSVRQEYQGLPGHHPQAQGLFSTLKPVKKEDYTTFEPHFVIYHSNRAKTSCHNCRVSKKKASPIRLYPRLNLMSNMIYSAMKASPCVAPALERISLTAFTRFVRSPSLCVASHSG